ncbi:MAG: hypothetical protein QGI86_12955 [Candidatus Poribacteria bacterium]|nr:hypothetical protein [Candidatus Poribacteria bacterium]MDP6746881.1 hypothetical protein [Candidatus Poribacteria bacterium]MDP6998214.1 hypothetical protein [Candidatus Poribacteria bacterium]
MGLYPLNGGQVRSLLAGVDPPPIQPTLPLSRLRFPIFLNILIGALPLKTLAVTA